jgi:hypothetical protein
LGNLSNGGQSHNRVKRFGKTATDAYNVKIKSVATAKGLALLILML